MRAAHDGPLQAIGARHRPLEEPNHVRIGEVFGGGDAPGVHVWSESLQGGEELVRIRSAL